MKTRLFGLLLALATFGLTATHAAPPSGLMDFTSGNISVQAKFTTYITDDINLLESDGESTSPTQMSLSDEGYANASFTYSDGLNVNGSFSLYDDGYFSFTIMPFNDATTFTLTLDGLFPEDGSIIDGFTFFNDNLDDYGFYIEFSFENAASGVVVISGNLPNTGASDYAYFDGSFTSSAIPEPASAALGLAAAAGVLAAYRRRRAA